MTRAGVALGLLVVFHAVAFGLRSWQQRRATGSTGFHGVSGRPGSAEWFGGALFAAGIALGLVAAVGEALGLVRPLWQPGALSVAIGVLVTVAGIAATYAAQLSMGDAWRIGVRQDERTTLVTGGAFAVVRNPIFACMLWTAGGLVMLLPDAWSVASIVCVAVAVELQVRLVEEPHLLRVHGPRYRAYAARVGRFAPGLGLLR